MGLRFGHGCVQIGKMKHVQLLHALPHGFVLLTVSGTINYPVQELHPLWSMQSLTPVQVSGRTKATTDNRTAQYRATAAGPLQSAESGLAHQDFPVVQDKPQRNR